MIQPFGCTVIRPHEEGGVQTQQAHGLQGFVHQHLPNTPSTLRLRHSNRSESLALKVAISYHFALLVCNPQSGGSVALFDTGDSITGKALPVTRELGFQEAEQCRY
jgi:hypothetical protein